MRKWATTIGAAIAIAILSLNSAVLAADDETFSQNEILAKAEGFFGSTTKGLAEGIGKVFKDQGRPVGYIAGEEFGGAFVVGLRYGRGKLHRKVGIPQQVYWQGPSVGFDFGGNVSKVFTLVYHLDRSQDIYRRFPGIDGSLYVVAGISLNYQQAGKTILAPIRTGAGLRAGVNVGYLHYNSEHSWLPF
jgi:hypothetical protein